MQIRKEALLAFLETQGCKILSKGENSAVINYKTIISVLHFEENKIRVTIRAILPRTLERITVQKILPIANKGAVELASEIIKILEEYLDFPSNYREKYLSQVANLLKEKGYQITSTVSGLKFERKAIHGNLLFDTRGWLNLEINGKSITLLADISPEELANLITKLSDPVVLQIL